MKPSDALTKQEVNVLALVAQGWRTAKIAEALFISPRTVETHIGHIFQKLGVSSRTEAAIYVLQAEMDAEIRTNPDDTFESLHYPNSDESRDYPRTLVERNSHENRSDWRERSDRLQAH